jgi:hypothetical protein
MSSFQFIERQKNGCYEYHLVGSRRGFISATFFEKYILEVTEESFFEWLDENCISSFATMENTLLYTILLHHLIDDKSCLLAYFGEVDEIKRIQDDVMGERIEWRYSIEFGEGLSTCEDFGFLNPSEFLHKVDYFNKDLNHRYFYLAEIKKNNLGRYIRIFHSDVTNWSFIFCKQNSKEKIKNILSNTDARPGINEMLADCEIMVHLQIGEDEGYLDYILIHVKESIKEKLNDAEKIIHQFIRDYESLLAELEDVEKECRDVWFKKRYRIIFENALKNR